MRGATPPRGGPAVAELRRRLVLHELRVGGDDEVLDALGPLLPSVAIPLEPVGTLAYDVERVAGGFVVLEEGDQLATAATAADAADAVYVRAHRRAFERASLAGWVRVHAATIDLDGARALLVGPSGTGKTTLALSLLLDGVTVHGDESALLRAGASVAVPRPFHVKPATWGVLDDLPVRYADLPRAAEVAVLDPARLGPVAVPVVAPVDHVVLLERTGEPAAHRAAATAEVVDALVRDAFVVTESSGRLLKTLVAAVGGARRHRLTIGEPAATVGELRRALC